MITFNLAIPINEIVIPLYGLQATTGSTYLFEIENSSNFGSPEPFLVTDVSSSPDRYQKFLVPTSGLTLQLGDYTYSVYESPTGSTSPFGLNLLGIGRWLTTGITTLPIPNAYQNPSGSTFPSYKNPYYT